MHGRQLLRRVVEEGLDQLSQEDLIPAGGPHQLLPCSTIEARRPGHDIGLRRAPGFG